MTSDEGETGCDAAVMDSSCNLVHHQRTNPKATPAAAPPPPRPRAPRPPPPCPPKSPPLRRSAPTILGIYVPPFNFLEVTSVTKQEGSSPDVISEYPLLVGCFLVPQITSWVLAILMAAGIAGRGALSANEATTPIDVSFCLMMFLGTLHKGAVDDTRLRRRWRRLCRQLRHHLLAEQCAIGGDGGEFHRPSHRRGSSSD